MQYACSAVIFCGEPAWEFFWGFFQDVCDIGCECCGEVARGRVCAAVPTSVTVQFSYRPKVLYLFKPIYLRSSEHTCDCSRFVHYYTKLTGRQQEGNYASLWWTRREHSLYRFSIPWTLFCFVFVDDCKTRKERSPLDVTIYLQRNLLLFCTQRISVSAVHYNDIFK